MSIQTQAEACWREEELFDHFLLVSLFLLPHSCRSPVSRQARHFSARRRVARWRCARPPARLRAKHETNRKDLCSRCCGPTGGYTPPATTDRPSHSCIAERNGTQHARGSGGASVCGGFAGACICAACGLPGL